MTLYEINQELENVMENAIDPETGEINEEYLEKLEQLQMDRDQKIENIACYIKNLKSDAEALKNEKMNLAKRQQIAENKAERLKDYLTVMLNGEKFKSAKAEISFRRSTSVECEDINLVPDEYLRHKDPEVDKTLVKKALQEGKEIAGCKLVENVSTQVK